MDHAYWGPQFNAGEIDALLAEREGEIAEAGCTSETSADAPSSAGARRGDCRRQGVGWFQGRMEWGPRALGNRSIVCDPRRADMKDDPQRQDQAARSRSARLRPRCSRKQVAEWFEEDDDVPFMMQVFQIRAEKRPLIPAVTHVDGSGRLQTVVRAHQSALLSADRQRSATSPACRWCSTPRSTRTSRSCASREEALDCFLRTRMDVLVMGHAVLSVRCKLNRLRAAAGGSTDRHRSVAGSNLILSTLVPVTFHQSVRFARAMKLENRMNHLAASWSVRNDDSGY